MQHIFFCLETHIYKTNEQEQISTKLPDFNIYWKLAEKRFTRGRGISGMLIGWKKDLKNMGIAIKILEIDDLIIMEIGRKNDSTIRILPVYLRGENWMQNFEKNKDIHLELWVSKSSCCTLKEKKS
ncbi:hypothetical protein ACFFRR_000958 [Megaselia abdita]